MATYKIFVHSSHASKAVKQGWSWPAFLVPHLWTLWSRLWGYFVCVALVAVAIFLFAEIGNMTHWLASATLVACELTLRIIFAANGNSWRELNLIMRGYREDRLVNIGGTKLVSQTTAMRSWNRPRVMAIWRDPVWSKLIAGGIAAISVSVAAYALNGADRTKTFDPRHTFVVPTCTSAILNAHVKPDSVTTAWFEWGPTPDLGNVTPGQRVNEPTDIYQHLIGLSQGTIYYYKIVSEKSEGKVLNFETSICR